MLLRCERPSCAADCTNIRCYQANTPQEALLHFKPHFTLSNIKKKKSFVSFSITLSESVPLTARCSVVQTEAHKYII